MKRSHMYLSSCCLIAILAGVAVGQPDKKSDPKATPAAPAMPSKGEHAQPAGMPAMTPEQMEQMKAWQEAATPGPMQEFLTKGCGTWEGKVKWWETPDATASESNCTTTTTSMMDGRFIKSETKGMMKMGEMSMPFEGFGIYGYNNTSKQFESTWCDSWGTMQMNLTGKLSDDKKTLTWQSNPFMCPMTHKETWMREVQTFSSADSMKLEMYGPDMSGKVKEFKMMEITYTRKAGTAPAATMPMKDAKPGMPAMTAPKAEKPAGK
jgi:hypothetical protein